MENILANLKAHHKNILFGFQKFFIQLQTHGYAGFYPLVVMQISQRMAFIDNIQFEVPGTLKTYIHFIKLIHQFYMYSTDLINIYNNISLDRDISSTALDRENIEEDLLYCKRKYKEFRIFYEQYIFLNYIDKFIEGELDEKTILSILNEGDIYDLLPFIKYVLKHVKISPAVHIKMESLKNNLLGVKDENISAVNTIQNLITYQNLTPATAIAPLEVLLQESLSIKNIHTLKDLATIKNPQYGFIVICKILPTSIYYKVWQLFRGPKPDVTITAGVNKEALELFDTIKIDPVHAVKDQIMVINRKDYNYVLQTTDGINFMFMKEVGGSQMLCGNASFRPSMRVNTYNSIIGAELEKHIRAPFIQPFQTFQAENVDGIKTNMLVHIMQDLRESGLSYEKFFEKYDYENLILLTIENVLQSVPSEHIFPYINYEFKCMYYYDLYQFRNAMRGGIMDGIANTLNLNEGSIRSIVDKVLYKLIVRDRRNIFNNLNKKIILLLELFR